MGQVRREGGMEGRRDRGRGVSKGTEHEGRVGGGGGGGGGRGAGGNEMKE